MQIIPRNQLNAEQRAAADRAQQRATDDGSWEPMPIREAVAFWAVVLLAPTVVAVIGFLSAFL